VTARTLILEMLQRAEQANECVDVLIEGDKLEEGSEAYDYVTQASEFIADAIEMVNSALEVLR
jgi:hypothetical protein